MPHIVRPTKAVKTLAALVCSVLTIGVVPAVASAACPATATTKAFAKFGDEASYSLLTGGTFESGAPGWSLSKSEVIAESSPMGGSHALAINPGGQAVSPGFCVSSEYPSFRFLYRDLRGGGKLYVALRYSDSTGSHEASVASLETGSTWAVSPVLALAGDLPLSSAQEGTLTPVQLVFSTNHPGLAWAIDAIYIDPYSR
jgi:hypothetical protein